MGSVLSACSSPDSLLGTANTHDLAHLLDSRDHAAVLAAICAQPQLLRAPLLPGGNTLWHAIARSGDAQLLALLFQELCAEHASNNLTPAAATPRITVAAISPGAGRASPDGALHGLTGPPATAPERTTRRGPFAHGPRTPSPGREGSRTRLPIPFQQRLSGEWQQVDNRDSPLEAPPAAAAAAAAAGAPADLTALPPYASPALPARCQYRLHQYSSCPTSTDLSGAYSLAGSELASSSSLASTAHTLPPTNDGSPSPSPSPSTGADTPRSTFRRARRPAFGPGSPTRDTVPAPRAPLHQHHQLHRREYHVHGHEHHSERPAGHPALTWSPSTPLPSTEAGAEGPQAAAAACPGPLRHPTDHRHRLSRRQGHSETCISASGVAAAAAAGRHGNATAAALPSNRTHSSRPLTHIPAPNEHAHLAASASGSAASPPSSAGNQSSDPDSGQGDLAPYSRSHSPRSSHTHSAIQSPQADPTAQLASRPDYQCEEVPSSRHSAALPPATLPSVPAPGPRPASDCGPPGSASPQRSSSLPSRLRLRRGLVRVLRPLLSCGGAPHADAAAAGAAGHATPLQDAGGGATAGWIAEAAADGRPAGNIEGGGVDRRHSWRGGGRRRQLQEQGAPRGGALDAAAVARLLNVPNSRGQTPLMVACAHGSSAVVALLLRKGADPWACDPARRHTALHCAVLYGQYMAAKLLLGLATANHLNHRQRPTAADLPADGDRRSNSSGGTGDEGIGPLDGNLDNSTSSSSSTSPRTLSELLEARSSCGATALHYASDLGHVALVELLLRHGADPTAQVLPRPGLGLLPACWRPYGMSPAAAGSTALHLAARGGELHVALAMLRHHAARWSERQTQQQEPHPQDALAPPDPRSIRDAAGLLPHHHARLHRSYRLALLLRPDYPSHWLYDTPAAAIALVEARAAAAGLVAAAAAGQGDDGGVQTLAALAAAALSRGLMQQLDAAEAAAASAAVLPAPSDDSAAAARRALRAQLELDYSASSSNSSSSNSLASGDWGFTASADAVRQRSGRPRVQRSLRSSLLGPFAAGPCILAEPRSPTAGGMDDRVDGRRSNRGGDGGGSDGLLSALARADTAAVAAIVEEAAAAEGADGSRHNVGDGGDGDGAVGELPKPPPTPLPWESHPAAAAAAAAAVAAATTGSRTHPGLGATASHGAPAALAVYPSPGPSLLRHPGAAAIAAAAAERAAARAAIDAAAALSQPASCQQPSPSGFQAPGCTDAAVTGRPSTDGNASVSASGSCGVCYEDGPLLLVAVRGCGHRLCCQCARRLVVPCLGQGHGLDGRQAQHGQQGQGKAGLQPRCPFCRGGIDAFVAVQAAQG